MKDIMLRITGKTLSAYPKNPDDPENKNSTIEFLTHGQMASRGGITKILYDETDISGMAGCKTQIIISGQKLKMQRTGKDLPHGTTMEFEEGKRYKGLYETPYGSVTMEILTNAVNVDNPEKISVDYSLSLQGILESRNALEIEVIQ